MCVLSRIRLFVTPGTVTHQVPLSNGTCGKIKTSDTVSQAAIDSSAER